ncbi:hypothetical protein RJT34_22862 [Clitoria ternatea]|uniref:EF-hand domain-containing protein n=1 Tax=Clitoria ternatea TaxID=43366 RepID=A0AAN9FRR5_CLITE
MSVAVVNSWTITEFVKDTAKFDSFVKEWFDIIDENRHGKVSCDQICGGFGMIFPSGSESMLKRFDEDGKGVLDLKGFKSFMKEVMDAIARGIGGSPVIVALGKDSLLMNAAQHELASRS